MAMDSIRINNLNPDIFRASADQFGGSKERATIVNAARMLMAERAGLDQNALRANAGKDAVYESALKREGLTYEEANKKVQRNLMLYCAKQAANVTGEVAPDTYEKFAANGRMYSKDPTFLRVLSGIVRDIITPVLPAVMSGALDWLAQTVTVPLGQTYEIDVASNDIFLFEDDSWGASRSKPSNYQYTSTVTLNPRPKTAKATWKWYQLAGNNADLGRTFNAIAAGMYSKITAMWTEAMVKATADTKYMPTNMQFTFSNANWITAAKRVAMLNRVGVNQVMAFGDYLALSHVLPSTANGTNTNLDAALATMLGVEWARYGYLGDFMNVRLFPIENAVVPGTQNTTITEVVPNNMIWMFAAPGAGYKPVYVAFEEGTPIQIQLEPSETADFSIDVIVTTSLDAKPVFASRGAVIQPV